MKSKRWSSIGLALCLAAGSATLASSTAQAQRFAAAQRSVAASTRGLAARLRRPLPRARAARVGTWSEPTRGEWSRDSTGHRSDPVNLYIHAASLDELRATFTRAGWSESAPNNRGDNLRYLRAVAVRGLEVARSRVTGRPIRTDVAERTIQSMPVSPQTYQGHLEVAAFEKNNHVLAGRHHFRVYDTGRRDAAGRTVWAVSASRDIGLEFDPHRPTQGFLNHRIEPDADLERDTVEGDLRAFAHVESTRPIRLDYGRAAGSGLHSQDGHALDVVIAP